MYFLKRLLNCIPLTCAALQVLLLCSASGQEVSPSLFVETLVQTADSWKTTPLPGEWKPLPGGPGPARKEAAASEPVFGSTAQKIVATEDGGKLTRMDVLFMERGAAAADEALQQSMRQAASAASAGIQSKMGKPGRIVKAPASAVPGTVVQEWSTDAATLRLTLEPGARLYASMIPLQPAVAPTAVVAPATAAAKPSGAKPKPAELKARVVEKPNGDVIITGLPEVPTHYQNSNTPLRTAQCLAGYYGWTMDVEAVAIAGGWIPASDGNNTINSMTAISKEAKVEMTRITPKQLKKSGQGLDLFEVRRWIDKGRPVVYQHVFTEVRDSYLIEFNQQYEKDPKLELPSAKDPAEKSKWPRAEENTNYYVKTMLIIGYNKKRGEFVLKQPGNQPGTQIMRVREEELTASLTDLYYIPPD